MRTRALLVLLAVVAGLGAVTARVAGARASGPDVRASLTIYRPSRGLPVVRTLTISRAGHPVYRAPVTYEECGHRCSPPQGPLDRPVRIVSLDGENSLDVLLTLYTGGAHCCTVAEVFRPNPASGGRYRLASSYDFADDGYRLRTFDGSPAFVTADDSFAEAFTDFAASGRPLQIRRLRGTRWVDVTRAHPALVRADAAGWLTAYRKLAGSDYRDSVGVIAAWVADEATLGRRGPAFAYLRAQARAGRLRSAFGRSDSGDRFITALQRLLRRDGYPR